MPRPTRIHVKGALYYVTSRAVEGGLLFKDARDYHVYLELLREYQDHFGFKLFGFVLLPDHLHLSLELTNETTISAIMQVLNSRYTKYVTKRYGHVPHVFQERFKLTIAEKSPWLLRLTGYLHTHPLRSGLAVDLNGYAWSSYHAYLSTAPTATVGPALTHEVEEVHAQLSAERSGWPYDLYLQSIPQREWEEVRAGLQHRILGSDSFLRSIEEQSKPAASPAPLAEGPGPMPQPQPSGPRRRMSLAMAGSLVIACASLVAAALYAKNLGTLKETMSVLAQERALTFMDGLAQRETAPSTAAHLATFGAPFQLEGTAWRIQLVPMSPGTAATPQQDELAFQQGQLMSETLASQGFSSSNYTLTEQPNGSTIWETMQRNGSGDLVQWRGECRGTTLQGIMTRQGSGKSPETFKFLGVMNGQAEEPHHEI